MPQVSAAGRRLECAWIEGAGVAPALPTLVFLHEGLGSIRQWRDFPEKVARATGCRALVYDRYGYGNSEVLGEARVGVEFMHDGALNELPELLENLNIDESGPDRPFRRRVDCADPRGHLPGAGRSGHGTACLH